MIPTLITIALLAVSVGFGLLWRYIFTPAPAPCRWCGGPCPTDNLICEECRKAHNSPPQ